MLRRTWIAATEIFTWQIAEAGTLAGVSLEDVTTGAGPPACLNRNEGKMKQNEFIVAARPALHL